MSASSAAVVVVVAFGVVFVSVVLAVAAFAVGLILSDMIHDDRRP